MTAKQFFDKFEYITDKKQYGVNEYWEEPVLVNGKYRCDCESVAIWLKRNVPEFADWSYYWCKINGGGHCILVSPDGKKMIDNNIKRVVTLESYKTQYGWTITELRSYKWYELAWKFASAKVIKLWLKLK